MSGARRSLVAWRGELGAVIGQHGVDGVGNGIDQPIKELFGNGTGGPFVQFDEGKLAGSVDGNEHV